jgi:hypothetical protein
MKRPILHNRGDIPCGKPAFLYEDSLYLRGSVAMSEHAAHLDGSPVKQFSAMHCDSCKRLIFPIDLELPAINAVDERDERLGNGRGRRR